ncbi:MAG: hypothetical protein CMJ28_07930 [Phycisphaerae bacterium]|nr:hypothetical protein [Phycisphaerae bacterium]
MPSIRLLVLAPTALLAFGCVPQDQYDSLLMANNTLEENQAVVESERDEALARIDEAEARVSEAEGRYASLQDEFGGITEQLGNSRDNLQAVRERLIKLEAGPLPTDMATNLVQLAATFSDLLTFEKESGTVRFNSDFTFSSGSDVLKDGTTEAISALAKIMNAASASGFECEVIGHTDNVKVSNPATRAKHKNNTYLAVHRAISVRTALVAAGVNAARIKVAGYGEYRPVVANSNKGAAQNRRVEIVFASSTMLAELPAASDISAPATEIATPIETEEYDLPK